MQFVQRQHIFLNFKNILDKASDILENVNVNKQLILRGIDSNGGGAPVVDAGWIGSAFWIGSSGVTLDGFNIRNSSEAGINVNSNNNVIRNNIVLNNQHGIDVYNSANNTISNNNVSQSNGAGIILFNSSGNNINSNIASFNDTCRCILIPYLPLLHY